MKQADAVVLTLERLGGVANLGLLNQEVFKIDECTWGTRTPFASIRRIVQTDQRIFKIKPGLYGLRSHETELKKQGIVSETTEVATSAEAVEFNHSYYQGLALTIGQLKGHGTYCPAQDQNKVFLNQTLGTLRTVSKLPPFSYEPSVRRASTIDVIWLNEREMPQALIEIEHSTDIQNSLLKFADLRDFYTDMMIVSHERRKTEFEQKISYSAFREIKASNRVRFVDYEALNRQYELLLASRQLQAL